MILNYGKQLTVSHAKNLFWFYSGVGTKGANIHTQRNVWLHSVYIVYTCSKILKDF
jgi:hypothetical protein